MDRGCRGCKDRKVGVLGLRGIARGSLEAPILCVLEIFELDGDRKRAKKVRAA